KLAQIWIVPYNHKSFQLGILAQHSVKIVVARSRTQSIFDLQLAFITHLIAYQRCRLRGALQLAGNHGIDLYGERGQGAPHIPALLDSVLVECPLFILLWISRMLTGTGVAQEIKDHGLLPLHVRCSSEVLRCGHRKDFQRVLAFRQPDKELLCVESWLRLPSPFAQALARVDIRSVSLQETSFCRIGQVHLQNRMTDPISQKSVPNRTQHFNALIKIARHPVGASGIDLFRPAIEKIIDAAVLQEAAHDTAHTNAAAYPTNTGAQSTNSTDDQIDLYSSLRSTIQRCDDVLVEQRVHFGNDARRTALSGM